MHRPPFRGSRGLDEGAHDAEHDHQARRREGDDQWDRQCLHAGAHFEHAQHDEAQVLNPSADWVLDLYVPSLGYLTQVQEFRMT